MAVVRIFKCVLLTKCKILLWRLWTKQQYEFVTDVQNQKSRKGKTHVQTWTGNDCIGGSFAWYVKLPSSMPSTSSSFCNPYIKHQTNTLSLPLSGGGEYLYNTLIIIHLMDSRCTAASTWQYLRYIMVQTQQKSLNTNYLHFNGCFPGKSGLAATTLFLLYVLQ